MRKFKQNQIELRSLIGPMLPFYSTRPSWRAAGKKYIYTSISTLEVGLTRAARKRSISEPEISLGSVSANQKELPPRPLAFRGLTLTLIDQVCVCVCVCVCCL